MTSTLVVFLDKTTTLVPCEIMTYSIEFPLPKLLDISIILATIITKLRNYNILILGPNEAG